MYFYAFEPISLQKVYILETYIYAHHSYKLYFCADVGVYFYAYDTEELYVFLCMFAYLCDIKIGNFDCTESPLGRKKH